MSARTISCDDCERTGHRFRHEPCRDDPYYMHETNEPCAACAGEGFIEVQVRSIDLDDLDCASAALSSEEQTS